MENKILEIEKSFFKLENISDKEWIAKTIHDDYKELGASGSIFNKDDVIDALLECKEDRDIDIYNYECTRIGDDIYLVHYITDSDKLIYRTSVWKEEEGLKMLFHQASFLKTEVDLVKY